MADAAQDGRLHRVHRGQRDLVALDRVEPRGQVVGVEGDRHLGALVAGVDLLVGAAHLVGDRRELQRRPTQAEPHGRVLGEDLHTPQRLEQGLTPDREHVRVRRGQQVLHVRIVAFDQPRGEPRGSGREHRLARTEPHAQLGIRALGQHALQFGERPAGYEHVLTGRQQRRLGQVAHGQSVRVGGDHLHAALVGRDLHAREHRPGIVGRCRAHHLAQGRRELLRAEGDGFDVGCRLGRIVTERQRAHRELRTACTDRQFVVAERHLDRAGRQGAHDVGDQARRHDCRAGLVGVHRNGELDRQLEIGSRDLQLGLADVEPEPGKHRQRSSPATCGPTCGGERLGQDLSLATELHSAALLPM